MNTFLTAAAFFLLTGAAHAASDTFITKEEAQRLFIPDDAPLTVTKVEIASTAKDSLDGSQWDKITIVVEKPFCAYAGDTSEATWSFAPDCEATIVMLHAPIPYLFEIDGCGIPWVDTRIMPGEYSLTLSQSKYNPGKPLELKYVADFPFPLPVQHGNGG
jgi:hypothetical protein